MESIVTVRKVLPQDCYMVLLDLKDAYLHVPIAETSSAVLSTAIRRTLVTPNINKDHGRSHGLFVAQGSVNYCISGRSPRDLFAVSPNQLIRDLELTKKTPTGLGWPLNLEKSSLIPAQRIT